MPHPQFNAMEQFAALFLLLSCYFYFYFCSMRNGSFSIVLHRLLSLNLLFDFLLRFLVGFVRNAFRLPILQEEDEDNGRRDDAANVEPEIIFFVFHYHTSTERNAIRRTEACGKVVQHPRVAASGAEPQATATILEKLTDMFNNLSELRAVLSPLC